MSRWSPIKLYGEDIPSSTNFIYLGVEFNYKGVDPTVHYKRLEKKIPRPIVLYGFSGPGFSLRNRILLYKSVLRSRME